MKSFRTELEDPVVERDIVDLEKKIHLFKNGKMNEERFRSLRLARGIYGQRQQGVQMIRIKLPYGKVMSHQLRNIASVSDEYSNGRLHITTRQDIQIHYVSLDRTPELWEDLAKDDVTIREACGNTVRNITASPDAGINPEEPFDVSPYAHALFQYFLRNPICQEMGRKFKISFSSSDEDTGLSYIHDLGFIPKIKDGEKGFKVMLGGGLGSQPRHADVLYEFLPTNKIIPVTEGVLRIFDRHGERSRRLKARMKFLISGIGFEGFIKLVEEEQKALPFQTYEISEELVYSPKLGKKALEYTPDKKSETQNSEAYKLWKSIHVFPQKQEGFVSIGIKVSLGNFNSDTARDLADLIEDYAAGELRFSLRQNILIRHVREDLSPLFYRELKRLGFVDIGYESTFDITACPGTDTCNLGIASSTGIARELEKVLMSEYPEYLHNKDLFIKISGCMNACGQHNMSPIGFQGMSIKKGKLVAPALQILLGGSPLKNGKGRFSDKVIKIPSKRGPEALRKLIEDYQNYGLDLPYSDYYQNQGKPYFYELLKPLSNTESLNNDDFMDWGYDTPYVQAVGVGECAGVVIDLVATLFFESEEKISNAQNALRDKKFSDSVYHSYGAMISTAKAMLLSEEQKTNTHAGIISAFDEVFVKSDKIKMDKSFSEMIYQIKKQEPDESFSKSYLNQAKDFFALVTKERQLQLENI